MQVYVNGESLELAAVPTVRNLLEQLDLVRPQVAVEVNQQLVPRRDHDFWQLHEGDRIEIVTLVGGG